MTKIKTHMLALCMFILLISYASADSESVRFVYFDQFEPFSWLEEGRMRGMFIDIVNEVFEVRLGIPVQHEGYPWKRAQQMVELGSADAMCTIATPLRKEYADAISTPMVKITFRLFTAADHPEIDKLMEVRSIEDLKDMALVDIAGSGWAASNLKGMDVYFADSYGHMFELLKFKRVDAAVRNDWQTLYLLKKTGYSDSIVDLPTPISAEPLEYTILIGKKSPFITELEGIDEVLMQMEEEGALQEIYSRYR